MRVIYYSQEADEMLKPKSPQSSFFMSGTYLYDRIVPTDHLLRKINQWGPFQQSGMENAEIVRAV